MQVLIVENSSTLRAGLRTQVITMGHTVQFAETGEEALHLIEMTPRNYDLVIMAVEMPGLSGFETARLMRDELHDHWIPIIFISGKDDDEYFEEGIDAGGDDYLIKPVSRVILQAKLRAMERIINMRAEMEKLNQQLTELSSQDPLTHLLNRRAFTERARQAWAIAARQHHALSVIMLDLDHFKQYNDNYGHIEGDNCLIAVASTLKDILPRQGDLLARYGGEEFIVLLENANMGGALQVANRIKNALKKRNIPHAYSTAASHVTASIGVASTTAPRSTTLEELINQADTQLYVAKEKGRNRVAAEESRAQRSILIVDDNKVDLMMISSILQETANLILAEGGDECLDFARQLKPDLILMDVMMPGLDGYEICQRLKEDAETQDIPVIFVSGSEEGDLIEKANTYGGQAVVKKPLNTHELLQVVRRFLN
ncbi:MAG: diguanylate cyclase [Cellvibrionaceae bacterium]